MEPDTLIKRKNFKNIIYCIKCKSLSPTKDDIHKKHRPFEIPEELLNTLIFEDIIGTGGYGAVFRCLDIKLKIYKAVKIMFDINDDDTANIDQQILRTLNHQYIIKYHGEGRDDEAGWAYLSMELAEMDLKKALEMKIFETEEKKLALFKQICKGIKYLHYDLKVNIYLIYFLLLLSILLLFYNINVT